MHRQFYFSVVLLLATLSGLARADTMAYTSHAQFLSDLAGSPDVLDFDELTSGDIIGSDHTVDRITFTYNLGERSMMVVSGSSTTSGSNYLGTAEDGFFQGNDGFGISFAPSTAIGLYIVSESELSSSSIILSATVGNLSVSAYLNQDDREELDNSFYAYFLGLITSDGSITSAQVWMPEESSGGFFYAVDDVITAPLSVVPTPSAGVALIGMGVVGMWLTARKKRRMRM